VVEDNLTNQEVALGMLAKLGYGADVVADGRGALHALRNGDYNLVLLDCQLPDLDGYEVARLVRRPETPVRNHDVPIVAMTAYALPGDQQKCLDAGMNGYVPKPVQPADLKQALEQCLVAESQRSPAAGLSPASATTPPAAAFNPVDLIDRLMGDEQLAARVVAQCLKDIPVQLASLAEALRRADAKTAQRAAHTIRGAAATAGGTQLSRHAEQMEKLGEAGDLAALAELLPGFNAQFEAAREEMSRFCQPVPKS
jgi:CheY-like chemotaxis protein/HPt (histidine-containing phosphotransfer) domain-containing protein